MNWAGNAGGHRGRGGEVNKHARPEEDEGDKTTGTRI